MKKERVIIVNIFDDVIKKVREETGFNVNYVYGRTVDILANLKHKDESTTLKNTKYPLFALYMPFREKRGGTGFYCDLTIRKIVIATLSNADDTPMERYQKSFPDVLYPVYESFLKQMVRSKYVMNGEVDELVHDKFDVPGNVPAIGINDFIDLMQLENLQVSINQLKYC